MNKNKFFDKMEMTESEKTESEKTFKNILEDELF